MKRPHLNLWPPFLLVIIVSLFLSPPSFGQQPVTILLAPFNIHSQQNMSFLNSGIASMLRSRLERQGAVNVVRADVEPGNEPAARAYAQKMQADYLLTGNLTIFGDSVSTDASFYDVREGSIIVEFHEYGKNSGDVLAHIDAFANQINAKLENRQSTQSGPSAAGAAVAASPAVAGAQPQTKTAEPTHQLEKETKLKQAPTTAPATTGRETPSAGAPPAAVAVAPAKEASPAKAATATAAEASAIWKSQTFNFGIDGMTVADVDGDGQNETVLIGDSTVHIFRLSNGRLAKVHEYKAARHLILLAVDAVDLNHNGRAEIFVTSLSRRGDAGSSTRSGRIDRLGSFALEWQDSGLKLVADDLRYYFRVIDFPGSDRILAGQKRAVVSSADWFDTIDGKDQLFVKGIYKLVWRNGQLEEGDRLDVPDSVNVLSFTTGDLFNGGRKMVAVEQENRYLKILDPEGRTAWESGERYGGSTRYLEYPAMSGREPDRFYLPQRMVVADTNQDGKNDLLVVKNEDSSRGIIGRVRVFRNGRAEVLSWNGVTMQQQWQSDILAGQISDIAWADIDNDGSGEAVLAIKPKGGSLEGSRGHIVFYRLK